MADHTNLMGFLDESELHKIGFKHIGKNVKISSHATFYNAGNISIDDYSRIDDFCVISAGKGGVHIGKYVHIAVYVSIIGKGEVVLEDFSGLSSKVAVYSSNDDYSGRFMTNPTVDSKYTNVKHGQVHIKKHALVGAGSIILPGVTLEVGSCIGAMSLIKNDCKEFGMYAGVPAKLIRGREKKLLKLEKDFLNNL